MAEEIVAIPLLNFCYNQAEEFHLSATTLSPT